MILFKGILFLILFPIFLLVVAFVLIVIYVLIWGSIANLITYLHYRKVAKHLENSHVLRDTFTYGYVTGMYRRRNVNWIVGLSGNYWFSPVTQVQFFLSEPDKINQIIKKETSWMAKYISSGREREQKVFFENNILGFHYKELYLSSKGIREVLERLSLIVEKFANGDFQICFHCGEPMRHEMNKCQKCSWSWTIESNSGVTVSDIHNLL